MLRSGRGPAAAPEDGAGGGFVRRPHLTSAINLNLLGVQFVTTPITLDLIDLDAGGVLGQLICTALDTVGNVVYLVGVLNSILSLLTGLLGGLTGGLTGGVTPTP